jgi:hypothetical protein
MNDCSFRALFDIVLIYNLGEYTCNIVPIEQENIDMQNVEMVLRVVRVQNNGGEDEDFSFRLMTSENTPNVPFIGYHDFDGRVRLAVGNWIRASNREKFVFSTVMNPRLSMEPSESRHVYFNTIRRN